MVAVRTVRDSQENFVDTSLCNLVVNLPFVTFQEIHEPLIILFWVKMHFKMFWESKIKCTIYFF